MRLHGFALVLLGWYLLVPSGQDKILPPMSRWGQFGAYDTAAECETERLVQVGKVMSSGKSRWEKWDPNYFRSVCIESSDPRLGQ